MVVGSVTRGCQVVVIGAGPGGYVAAIRLAQLGKDPLGTVLSVGAIYTVGPYLFPRLVTRLQELAPQMPLFIEESYTASLRGKLSGGNLDAIFIATPQHLHVPNSSHTLVSNVPFRDSPVPVSATATGTPSGGSVMISQFEASGGRMRCMIPSLGPGPLRRKRGNRSIGDRVTGPATVASPQRTRPIPVMIFSLPCDAHPAISATEQSQRTETS